MLFPNWYQGLLAEPSNVELIDRFAAVIARLLLDQQVCVKLLKVNIKMLNLLHGSLSASEIKSAINHEGVLSMLPQDPWACNLQL